MIRIDSRERRSAYHHDPGGKEAGSPSRSQFFSHSLFAVPSVPFRESIRQIRRIRSPSSSERVVEAVVFAPDYVRRPSKSSATAIVSAGAAGTTRLRPPDKYAARNTAVAAETASFHDSGQV